MTRIPHWQQQMFDVWANLGHVYHIRFTRNGSPKVSLDGHKATTMASALEKIERAMTNVAASNWFGAQ
jgi:hypothetical protein